MNSSPCRQFEIEIVDDILGNLPLKKARALKLHLAECSACRKLYAEWAELLKDHTNAYPSARLYRRLQNNFPGRQTGRKPLQPSVFRGTVSVALIGILILFALAAVQGKGPPPSDSWKRPLAEARDISSLGTEAMPRFISDDAETVQYLIDPDKGRFTSINGMIWINGSYDELYCLVRNLEENTFYDYQIWLIKPVKRENGGLLQIIDQYGEFYLRQKNIQEIRQISISREPKGGSFFPTTADMILVDFGH